MKPSFFIKTNRIFNPIRKYAWLFIVLVAFGGLWFPKLGLLMIPVMITLGVMGFLKGKYWCGNFCPHGSLFDFIILPISPNKKIPSFLKSKWVMGIAFAWFMFMLTSRLIEVFSIFGTASFWDRLGYIFVINYLVVTIVGTTLALLISPRTWCSFCPMGTFQIISHKLGTWLRANKRSDEKVSAKRTEMCHKCGKCSRVCPMQLTPYLEFSETNQFDSSACIRCSTCVENCPTGILSLTNEKEAVYEAKNTSTKGFNERKKIAAVIDEIKDLGNDIKEYTFKFVEPNKVDYKPGQFTLVRIHKEPEMYRAYSISSYNEDGTSLSTTVKRLEDGYGTNIIFENFKEGDNVELEGPMGGELVVDKSAEKILFVAGGLGITPFPPMVRDILENESAAKDVKLIYGVNYADEFIYDDYFKQYEYKDSRFEYHKVVAFDENWKGQKGFVTHVMERLQLDGYKVYLCGSKPMINATLKKLKDMDIDEGNVFYESA